MGFLAPAAPFISAATSVAAAQQAPARRRSTSRPANAAEAQPGADGAEPAALLRWEGAGILEGSFRSHLSCAFGRQGCARGAVHVRVPSPLPPALTP